MAKIKHAVVRTDLMHGTDVRGEVVSFKFFDSEDNPADIDNGNIVVISDLIDGERELFTAGTPAVDSAIRDIVLVADPEVPYDERLKNLDDYFCEAGKPARGYRLHSGDIFSVTVEAFDGTGEPAVGDIVEVIASTKLGFGASATSGSTVIGKVIEVATAGRYTFYAVKVD